MLPLAANSRSDDTRDRWMYACTAEATRERSTRLTKLGDQIGYCHPADKVTLLFLLILGLKIHATPTTK